jgi:putative ABC transport system ATP-binding protein
MISDTRSLPEVRHTLAVRRVFRAFTSGKVKTPVLTDVSLEVYPGELTLIMGPSGSGKTTLLAIMSGLLQPDSGRVEVLGQTIGELAERDLDRLRLEHVGFAFQGFNLFSALTALEQVKLILKYLGIEGIDADRRARAALAEVDLLSCAHLRPLELSGGQKQRVAIARSLVKDPRIIFADEPTSALDSANGAVVTDLLHKAARHRGATVVIVTHDPRLLQHADRVIQLEDGRIVRDERPRASIGEETGHA